MFESIELLKNSSLWVPCKRNNSDNSHFYPCVIQKMVKK